MIKIFITLFLLFSETYAGSCPFERHIFKTDRHAKISSSHLTNHIKLEFSSDKIDYSVPSKKYGYAELKGFNRSGKDNAYIFKSSKNIGYNIDLTEAHNGYVEAHFFHKNCVPAKKFVVVIDAGHGGKDPGALSSHAHIKEKDITLAVAKKLKSILGENKNIVSRMTREGDDYIALFDRVKFAHSRHADLFVSLHADSFYDKTSRGITLFTLSTKRAESTIARYLTGDDVAIEKDAFKNIMQENQKFYGMLFDMKMSNTVSKSLNAGNKMLSSLSRSSTLHSKKVVQAPFAVLTSFEVPSILIELGFLSNKKDADNLRSAGYQQKIAREIASAIIGYLIPEGVTHVVKKGDTLLAISKQYKQSINQIIHKNKLKSEALIVGQKIVV